MVSLSWSRGKCDWVGQKNWPHNLNNWQGYTWRLFWHRLHGLYANISIMLQATLNLYAYDHNHCLVVLFKFLGKRYFSQRIGYRKRPCISCTFFHKIQAQNQGCGLFMDTMQWRLQLVTSTHIFPPRAIKYNKVRKYSRGKWPTISLFFTTFKANLSASLPSSWLLMCLKFFAYCGFPNNFISAFSKIWSRCLPFASTRRSC